jgi:tRNA U34 5-methylaminomethyl-2-thiouridine-forming methyltransferase MnmC
MLSLIKTADGSNTIFNSEVGENYHSRNGTLQESRHVFLNAGLKYFFDGQKKDFPAMPGEEAPSEPYPPDGGKALEKGKTKVSPPEDGGDLEGVHILEVGFGTGLNFLLSADYCAENQIHLNYTGIEAYPLNMEMINQTGYNKYVSLQTWQGFINNYQEALLNPVEINAACKLRVFNGKLMDFQSPQQYDVIYFDAFASARQPEMWDEGAIAHTVKFLKPGGVFVTYAITGNLKRTIKSLGLKVEKAPGAPGKREMLRAVNAGL